MKELLQQHIIQPLNNVVGRMLEAVFYHDVFPGADLTTNGHIDIILQQLELVFEGEAVVYISWATIPGWMQYSLSVSHESFCIRSERYAPASAYWQQCKGKPLADFEVYGYDKETVIEAGADSRKEETYYNEPHLVILHFADHRIGVANWYAEENFIPRLPIGDDVWILFDEQEVSHFIEILKLDRLHP
ncbi:hypothetical protein [Hymenobacter koreensis]|uniref:CdiI C-terminal domain-containing protein n=1 Tax=Hymenobacter koreensis TaxID=1084523 RepID=A0ABP8J3P9_9BACT